MLHFAFLALLIKLETFYLCSANLCSAFRELRDDKYFVDVTLAWDDEWIQAHKVILALLIKLETFYLCSAYLCSAFRELGMTNISLMLLSHVMMSRFRLTK